MMYIYQYTYQKSGGKICLKMVLNGFAQDFHLHTRKDKEFKYSGDEDRFVSDYIDKLKEEKIGLGVITNHNKFDLGEFKALKKKLINPILFFFLVLNYLLKKVLMVFIV